MRARTLRIAEAALLAIAAALYAVHFVHLRADFPNYSPWPDWSKFTDEGWYGLAAIRHYQLGQWYLAGDFNPAVALPLWPLLEMLLFRFTGVSITAARALTVVIFGLILLSCYLLLRRWEAQQDMRAGHEGLSVSLAPAVAVLLLAASPFYFVFSRLAILEQPMILVALAGLLFAQRAGAAAATAWGSGGPGNASRKASRPERYRAIAWSTAVGLAIVATVLTKTTGAFLVPAILWMLWASCAYRLRIFVPAGVIAAAIAGGIFAAYMLLFVHPHYISDYRYLFAANDFTGITKATFWSVVLQTLLSVYWFRAPTFCMAIAAVAAALASVIARRFRGDSLTVSLLIWLFFYFAILAYHDNLSPRYYQAIGVPLLMLVAMGFGRFWRFAMNYGQVPAGRNASPPISMDSILVRLAAGLLGVVILCAVEHDAVQELSYVRHPEYTFVGAVDQIRVAIERQRVEDGEAGRSVHPDMVLSISGAQMQLMTGLPSICDDYGTMTLPDRVAAYKPGWFLTWNDVEDDKMEALAPVYHLVRVGAWPAFDDPDRNLLVLYRLDPLESPGRGSPRRRRSVRVLRRLQTNVGEQPTAQQLEH